MSPQLHSAPIELRPYQAEARDRILAELGRVRATLLVLATGLGKTPTCASVAAHYVERGGHVLVIAHRGELLEQAAATVQRFGLSVAVEQGDRRVDPSALPDVVVASVQTLRGKRLARFAPDAFALVIIDEAHHAAAKTYRAVLEHFVCARVLGCTATPDRADGVGLGKIFDSVAFRMELGVGIRGGWLSPIELRSVVVEHLDVSRISSECGDFVTADLEQALLDQKVLHEVAVPLAELARGRRTLVFVAGVKQAYALAAVLRELGIAAAAVDGGMSAEARAAVLEDYRAGRVQVLVNVAVLTEGYDEPLTSCVALVRPTRSRSLLTQMIGRGTRLAEGKTACLVLDFVPGRAGSIRLAAPADALAGEDLPQELLARVRRLSAGTAGELGGLIEAARAEQEAERLAAIEAKREAERERARAIRRMGLQYAAPRVEIADLLEAVRLPTEADNDAETPAWKRKPASESQVEALRRQGLDVPSTITRVDADALFDVLNARRAAGLCTLKQARQLRRFGLRDDMRFEDARTALDAIAANGWRPPLWLFSDARFSRREEQVA